MKKNNHKKIKLLCIPTGCDTITSLSNDITQHIFIMRKEITGPEYSTMRPYFNSTLEAIDYILNNLFKGVDTDFRLPKGIYSYIPKNKINDFENEIIKYIQKKIGVEITIT